ncbi:hypothetical protein [Mycobacterium aquaticum]|uniref:Uncharacterized protein n=1 Tax=Mycobacterium aquaticum TaxID=1927124 RepID=A0A1X0B782_9MYCO|nr:hypothetical protein [Mycobacterium aquaticum]ORA38069.1 hypothetical protein BST13_05570 [Mycobacterium aquaticum]
MITDLMRGAADFIDAVNQALEERRSGFSEREAGDYLDAAGLADAMVPDEFADDVVDAEVHCEGCRCPSYCACGREMYGEPESPDGPTHWFHRDDDSPITDQCRQVRDEQTTARPVDQCKTCGKLLADPVAAVAICAYPSGYYCSIECWKSTWRPIHEDGTVYLPGDFDAVTAACRAVMEWVDRSDNNAALIGCTPSMVAGVAVNAYRAALLSVGHADLAAHITGIQVSCLRRGMTVDATYDEIASDLLSGYSITKK